MWYNVGMNLDDDSNRPEAAGEGGAATSLARPDSGAGVGPMPDLFEARRVADTPVAPAVVAADPESAADWDTVDDQGVVAYTEVPAGGGLPRPIARGCVVMASLALIVAMLAVAVTGFTGSSWNYNQHRMDRTASQNLANLADAMTAAGAPQTAVLHVRAAAQPGLNRGAALEALAAAVQILATSGDDAHLVPLRRQLHRAYLEIYEKEYGTPPTPDRQPPTVPSFEARNHCGFWILDFGLADIA